MVIGHDLLTISDMIEITMFWKLLLANALSGPTHLVVVYAIRVVVIPIRYGNWSATQNSIVSSCFDNKFIWL